MRVAGPWWVQPWPERPFIPIRAGSTWTTETHLGFEYAALLVDQGYHPPPTIDVAPTQGAPVVLVKIVKGVGEPQLAPTKPIHFSGYDWKVRTISGDRGGMNNLYDGDNAWLDSQGALHLRIVKKQDRWSCAEVVLNQSLGYGTYVVTVRDVAKLEPAAVFSMTTFDDWGGNQYYREMDVEIGRWGDAAPFWSHMAGICGPHPTKNEARRFILHCQPHQSSRKSPRDKADLPDLFVTRLGSVDNYAYTLDKFF
jgi:hypothetical protein